MNKKLLGYVNTVESFIFPPFKQIAEAEIFGQGMRGDSIVAFEAQHHIHLQKNSFTAYAAAPTSDSNYIDTTHYFLQLKDLSVGRWLKGFSGSPVFLQDDKSKKWRVCGPFVSGLYDIPGVAKGGFVVVAQEYLLRIINSIR